MIVAEHLHEVQPRKESEITHLRDKTGFRDLDETVIIPSSVVAPITAHVSHVQLFVREIAQVVLFLHHSTSSRIETELEVWVESVPDPCESVIVTNVPQSRIHRGLSAYLKDFPG